MSRPWLTEFALLYSRTLIQLDAVDAILAYKVLPCYEQHLAAQGELVLCHISQFCMNSMAKNGVPARQGPSRLTATQFETQEER